MTGNQTTPLPVPHSTDRDDIGRITRLTIDSQPAPTNATGPAWLVALDGSAHASRALMACLNLMRQATATGTLHLAIVEPWLSEEAAESSLLARGWASTATDRAQLDAQHQPWQLHIAMGEPAETLAALVKQLGCQHLAIGNRGLGAVENLLIGSVAQQLIRLSPVPVLVVP